MADLKISQLPAVTMPLAETEVLPIVQSSTTKKVTVAELTTLIKHTMTMDNTNVLQFGQAGFTASINYNGDGSLRIKPRAGYPLQIDQANIKISDAGYGIDFSASTHTAGMTSELLNDYEEGTWTPNQGPGLVVVGAFSSNGTYTKIGRAVTVRGSLIGATSVSCPSAGLLTTNLPFTVLGNAAGAVGNGNVNQGSTLVAFNVQLYLMTAITASASIDFTVTYFV